MPRSPKKSDSENGLTGIPQPIHCAATTDGGGVLDDIDQIQVDYFLQTLAQIALAVAARKVDSDGGNIE